ncbi:general secretion pathway protein K [Syntrophus gentianae]|uniref:General secretion pathway protein K n=1 Tax=Syntrophus gentianae TaxID=43775 RepID=A0A1H7Z0M1_9BACT|nr:type II secretion system protein GspK [Syntrophus gentianae]SEM51970.1 general secretion pathway protein K [Syntrophus gentianae]
MAISLKKRGERGIVLIVVLCMTSVMVGASVQMISHTRREIAETADLGDGLRALYLARSGVAFSKALLNSEDHDYDGLNSSWADAESISARFNDLFMEGQSSIVLEDETGKIPINFLINKDGSVNKVLRDMLVRLLAQPEWNLQEEQRQEIVAKLQGWMASNASGSGSSGSQKTNSAADRKGPFQFPEEILKTGAITKDLLYGTAAQPGLNAYITLYGKGKMNINTAPKPVLKALFPGISETNLEQMDEYRLTEQEKLSDPTWYRHIIGTSGLNPASDLITIKSEAFRISSTGMLKGCRRTVTGILEKDGKTEKFKLRVLMMN